MLFSVNILEIFVAPSSLVAVPITVAPASHNVYAMALPIPLLAPVTRTNFSLSI
jgi:hypothetical protein